MEKNVLSEYACEYDVRDLHHETVDERQRDMRYSMFAHFQHEILFGF